jgi:hypothetical protein
VVPTPETGTSSVDFVENPVSETLCYKRQNVGQ